LNEEDGRGFIYFSLRVILYIYFFGGSAVGNHGGATVHWFSSELTAAILGLRPLNNYF